MKSDTIGREEVDLTLGTVNNLDVLRSDQGRREEAEMLYKRAMIGKKKALRPEHGTVVKLATLYRDQGRFEDAEMMYNRALAGYRECYFDRC